MHVPTGLFIYGMYQKEENNGTPLSFNLPGIGSVNNANDTDVWYVKAGIKRTWTPLGATVLFGEGGQYKNQFSGCAVSRRRLPVPADTGAAQPQRLNGGVCLNNDTACS